MKYNFDTAPERRGTDSTKWNVKENELPMWVADMDFETAPQILEAIRKRTELGAFGYADVTDDWYEAYVSWWKKRHGFEMDREWLMFVTGVVPAISSIVRKLTTPNEKVVVLTPVYNIFFNSIVNNGARPVECPMILREYGQGQEKSPYEIDFEALEKALSDPQCSLMIFCNPHNPAGKIWTGEEMERVGRLACKYNVVVISDEIHCDLVTPGYEYIPFASVSEECRMNSITCIAPTKTFNLAGMQTAAISVPNPYLRHKVWRAINTDEVAEPNSFACHVAAAAFNEGGDWVDELNEYIYKNRKRVASYIKEKIPGISLLPGNATYLLWLDFRGFMKNPSVGKLDTADELTLSERLQDFIREKTGLYLSSGNIYGAAGDGFLRMNIACPSSRLEDGLKRLDEAVKILEKEV